ncbi:hypothetical protein D6D02_05931 [Aureobasidium pullulans]|nr:hypothetical protein D6D03_08987 [Aureobasidium pullulans]THY11157.1 hypothetical protein D6D02_05931 [Aureobasidium pullulans]THY97105.1 hypothetical protein D6C92_03574 [Aureobasidium pullulans]TIA17494.1 hypothetical protein D6C81_05521 [Aureobasidium pullulans]TIA50376.1 hypothetical protein D6C79_03090 [Aureobasidium pullulans]
MSPIDEQPIYADVLGQWPQLKTYNHGSALYKAINIPREEIIREWEVAADTLTAQIPWLIERVVHDGITTGNTGRFYTAPWPTDLPPNKLLRFKDCTELLPGYQELHDLQLPIQSLDGKIICPTPGFPLSYNEEEMGPAPACIIQLNFIKDGVIVTFSNHHNVMDGTGLFNVIGMMALLLSGKPLPQEAIEQGNRDRATVVPLYPDGVTIKDHSYLHAIQLPPPPPASGPVAKWLAVRFKKSALSPLKALASDPEGFDKDVKFISSGDAVSALYWKTLAGIRVKQGMNPKASSKFSRAIDARPAVKVPMTFMGQMVHSVPTYFTHEELIDLPLSTIASALRKDLDATNNEYSVRSYATFIARHPDKSKLMYTGPFNRQTDIASSSMAQASLVLKFGLLGMPEFIRRPNLFPIPGTLYFYPPDVSGDLNLHVCLRDFEIEGLQADPLWGKAAELIG